MQFRNLFIDLAAGLRDVDLLTNLAKYFLLTLGFLVLLSMIFTAFELWKFVGGMTGGTVLLAEYLIYLTPFLYLQYLAPTAAMLAILATYVIKSRQTHRHVDLCRAERISPALAVSLCHDSYRCGELGNSGNPVYTGKCHPGLFEDTNSKPRRGHEPNRPLLGLRRQQRHKFRLTPASDNEIKTVTNLLHPSASDNDRRIPMFVSFNFRNRTKSASRVPVRNAVWSRGKISLSGPVRESRLSNGRVYSGVRDSLEVPEDFDPIVGTSEKPSYLSRAQLRERIDQSNSDVEQRMFAVAVLQKRIQRRSCLSSSRCSQHLLH